MPEEYSERYITEGEAASLTGLSKAWFQRARWAGDGPPYVKLGSAVRYRESVLRQWLDERVIQSTSAISERGSKELKEAAKRAIRSRQSL